MSAGFRHLTEYLDQQGVNYEVVHHRKDIHALSTAADTGTPPGEFAKTVLVWIDGKPAMAVVQASKSVSLRRLQREVGAAEVHVAHESDLKELCPDCEVGAAPPLGPLYDLPVYVSSSLAADEVITFNGGDHENAVRMRWSDYEKLVQPAVLPIAHHD